MVILIETKIMSQVLADEIAPGCDPGINTFPRVSGLWFRVSDFGFRSKGEKDSSSTAARTQTLESHRERVSI